MGSENNVTQALPYYLHSPTPWGVTLQGVKITPAFAHAPYAICCVDEKKSKKFGEFVVGNLKIKAFNYDYKLCYVLARYHTYTTGYCIRVLNPL